MLAEQHSDTVGWNGTNQLPKILLLQCPQVMRGQPSVKCQPLDSDNSRKMIQL